MKVNRKSYPVFANKKTLAECGEDFVNLDIKQSVLNINLPAIMVVSTETETIPFEVNGRTFLFQKERIEEIDIFMKKTAALGVIVTVILLNSPRLFDSLGEKELLEKCIHPDFDWKEKNAFLSAFSIKKEEGRAYFQAFVEFLAARYAGEDETKGLLRGMILSNEVNSQYMWGNAGEKTLEEYMEEYTATLRLTYLFARKYYSNMRVYISLDHLFNTTYDVTKPLCFYKGRDVLEKLNEYAKRDGDFDWSVAYHPYPESLNYPDFYNDRTAAFHFSTTRITFKNIEMLPAFLAQERYLYQGQERKIILSEQGFHSGEDIYSQKQGAAAYCLAYEKVKKLHTIDMLMHHAYVDNPHEFGLSLGIRKRAADGSVGEPKLIYYVMKDMGTDQEEKRIQEARSFIGVELYDRICYPEILCAEDPLAVNMDFDDQ